MSYKRDVYGSMISSGTVTRRGDGTYYYDTNVSCRTTYDSGVTDKGSHGRFAVFQDTRTRPFVGNSDDYNLSLVRGTVTSGAIPLFFARPSTLITEGGVDKWEVTTQPGLALTWTGPVYVPSTTAGPIGPQTNVDWLYAAYPNFGYIPAYTFCTAPGAVPTSVLPEPKLVNLSTLGVSRDCLATTVASRLTTLLTAAAGFPVTVTSPTAAPSAAMLQQYSIQNASLTQSLFLDFSLPPGSGQLGHYFLAPNEIATKAGILQACKLLGFIPGQVFVAPPNSTTLFPRAYQKGFCSTMNLYAYKTVRWVPEDTSARVPTVADLQGTVNPQTITYFDCYTYQHYLNNCINPTFERCIYDPFDENLGDPSIKFTEQSLERQLNKCCIANVNAQTVWNPTTTYAVLNVITPVVYQGLAWIATELNTGQQPSDASTSWQSCGAALNYSFVDGKVGYKVGDVVTICAGNVTYYSTATATTTGPPPASASSANGWTSVVGYNINGTRISIPSIATKAPVITFNSATSLFTLNLDSYGFGGTTYANADDGYAGVIDYTLNNTSAYTVEEQNYNASLNDIARDSWGATGINQLTTPPYVVSRRPNVSFDERLVVEADDYFHQLFGNWPALRLNYFDPRTQLTTSYVRYLPQAKVAGLATSTPLPLTVPADSTIGLSATYLPYGRIGGSVSYIYTFEQDYPSIGNMWNPFDAIVIQTSEVPVQADYTTPLYQLDDAGLPSTLQTNGNTLKIIADMPIRSQSTTMVGQEYRAEIVFEPPSPVFIELQSGRPFNQFDFSLFLRVKETNELRPLSLSDGGSAYFRWAFSRK